MLEYLKITDFDRDENGEIILHKYTRDNIYYYDYKEEELVKFLKKGIDINVKNIEGETSLHIAVLSNPGSFDIESVFEYIKLLIKYNIDVNSMDKEGDTALHKICKQITRRSTINNFDFEVMVTKLLLDSGAKINLRNYKGETALKLAMIDKKVKNIKQIKVLLENGANI